MKNEQYIDAETRICKFEGCQNIIQVSYRGRKRDYCSNVCKCKDYRIETAKKVKEYDFVRLQNQKLVALLTPKQRKKAHDWGLLI